MRQFCPAGWFGTGTLAGAIILGAMALVPTPEDRSEDASRIIESLSRPQQETDKLPAGALTALGMGIDPSQTRLLGHSATITYYGAPAGEKLTPDAPREDNLYHSRRCQRRRQVCGVHAFEKLRIRRPEDGEP